MNVTRYDRVHEPKLFVKDARETCDEQSELSLDPALWESDGDQV